MIPPEPPAAAIRLPEPTSIETLASRYDVFMIDQFGVLRDAEHVYAGVAEALAFLRAAGKRVIILSNSGKRSAPNEQRLTGLGLDPSLWDRFVSSGEVAWHLLGREIASYARPLRVLLIARDGDRSAVAGLGLELVEDARQADLVLLSASEGDHITLTDYETLLAPAAARSIPCICSNPDKIMLTPDGPCFGAGRIAELYQELGGKVRWIGKPFPEIYDAALAMVGGHDRRSVVCIGDSLEHDIAGGRNAGLATALVRTGIHADTLKVDLPALYRDYGARPDFVMPRFGLATR